MPSRFAGRYEPDIMVMICINLANGEFTSYRLPVNGTSKVDSLNTFGGENYRFEGGELSY